MMNYLAIFRRRCVLSMTAALTLLVAASVHAQPSSRVCTSEAVRSAIYDYQGLHDIAVRCADDSDVWGFATTAILNLPTPTPPQFSLTPHVAGKATQKVTYEIDVFFFVVEAYLHPEAQAKLATLFEKLAKCHSIDSVTIEAGADLIEVRNGMGPRIGRLRAAAVRSYLIAAGVPEQVIATPLGKKNPSGGATDSDADTKLRARQRSVSIRVTARQDVDQVRP